MISNDAVLLSKCLPGRRMEVTMWTVVYMAQSKEISEKLQQVLEEAGLLVKVRPMSKAEEGDNCYEILAEAHAAIIDNGF